MSGLLIQPALHPGNHQRFASAIPQHPSAGPSRGWILQSCPHHLPCSFVHPSFWEHSLNDAMVVQMLWRAVLSEAQGRVAWKDHQFTQSLQFWWPTSTTFSEVCFYNLCHINPHVYGCVITYVHAYGRICFLKLFSLPKLLPNFKCCSSNCFVILQRLFMKLYDRRKLCSMFKILL